MDEKDREIQELRRQVEKMAKVPVSHGRLIDADALIGHKFKNPISYNAFVRLVERMPTIIEAEEAEGGEER